MRRRARAEERTVAPAPDVRGLALPERLRAWQEWADQHSGEVGIAASVAVEEAAAFEDTDADPPGELRRYAERIAASEPEADHVVGRLHPLPDLRGASRDEWVAGMRAWAQGHPEGSSVWSDAVATVDEISGYGMDAEQAGGVVRALLGRWPRGSGA